MSSSITPEIERVARADHSRTVYARALRHLREALAEAVLELEDEGDRVYFGSTNHADDLRAAWKEADALEMDELVAHTQPETTLAEANLYLQGEVASLSSQLAQVQEALRAEADACLAAEMVALRLRRLVRRPSEPGSYIGDTFYPVGGTEASHRWTGESWEWLASLQPAPIDAALSPSPVARNVGLSDDVAELRKRLERYEGVRAGQWFYPEGNSDSDSCQSSPEEVLDEHYGYFRPLQTKVYRVERALPLPDLFGAVRVYSDEEKDARDSDDDYDVTWHLSADEADAALTSLEDQMPSPDVGEKL